MKKTNGHRILVLGLFPLVSLACRQQAETPVPASELTQIQSALSTDAGVATGDGGTLTPGEEDAFITQAWTQLGGAAVVGNSTASSANLPNGVGRYQTFANGVIVWSNTNGAVLVPTAIFNFWVGLVSQPAAEDPTRTQFDYLGLPTTTSPAPAADDTVAWDARTNFDRGLIGVTGGKIYSIQGNIYARYSTNPAKWGFPTGVPAQTNNRNFRSSWIGEAFVGGEIWTSGSPSAGFMTFDLEAGPVFTYWLTTSSLLDPTSNIQADGVGGEFGSFMGGNIYSSPPGTSPGGTFAVPSNPNDGNGNTLLSAYMALGGTKSWLGYPSAPFGTTAAGNVYSQFQNGLLVMYRSATGSFAPQAFGSLTFSYDSAQDTDSPGCFGVSIDGFCIGTSEGPFMQTQVTVFPTGSSTPIAGPVSFPGPNNGCDQTFLGVFTLSSESGVFCDGSQQQINFQIPLGPAQGATSITVDLVSEGYSANLFGSNSPTTFGHLQQVFDIDDHFGTNGAENVVASDNPSYNFTTHVIDAVPFDKTDYKGELWWSFTNFVTATLPYQDYIDTYVGVANNGFEGPADWSDELYYDLIYKGSAADGNCFGMALDSIDAAFSNRSAYNEPIHQYFEDPISTQGGQILCPDAADAVQNNCSTTTPNAQYAALGQELNVKFGYQLGVDMINYYLEGFTIGDFEEPSTALQNVTQALADNDHPVFGITSSLSFGNGHAIRPYRVGPSGQPCQNISGNNVTCTQVFVLDPNIPSATIAQEQFVEFSNDDRWAYIPTFPGGAKVYTQWEYSGGFLSNGIIVTTPYWVIDHRPYAPTSEIEDILAATVGIIILADGSTLSQVTDDSGRTLFNTSLTGPPAGWQSLATGASKIPNLFPILLPTDPVPNAARVYAEKGLSTKQMFDVGVSAGQPAGSSYEASFISGQLSADITAPGAPGTFDRVTLNQPALPGRSVSFMVPANGSAKTVSSWTVTGTDKKRPIVLGQMAVKPAQQITTVLENGGNRIKFENNGPATSATISIGKSGTLPVAVGTIQIPSGESGQDCSFTGATPTCTTMPPELNSIFGFESPSAWTGQGFPLKTVSSPKTQGSFALDVGGTNYREIFSQAFSTAILQGVTSKLALDIYVPSGPSNPFYLGAVQLYANCPSANIFHAYQDQVLLTGDPLGAFTTGKFNLQSSVVAAMKASHPDFSLSISVNAAPAAQDIVLDNLRFTN